MRATCSAGGFLGTAEDPVRFGSAHLSPGFFKPANLELLFKGQSVIPPGNQTVGILWRIGKDSTGRRVLYHAGASQGGRAMLLMYTESGIVVAMLSNILAPFGEQEPSG